MFVKVQKFRTPQFKVRNSFQRAKISVQGANSLNISFAHHYSRCENFRTVWNTSLAHEWHFTQPKPIFTPCETRCENFAHHNSRCEISLLLDTFLKHFLEFKLCIPYIILNIWKSGIYIFKRGMIWSWNKKVMAVWRRLCKAEWKCCSRTKFCYC